MNKKRQKKVLVVSAHPDDEVLGCAGTICNMIDFGYKVYSLILGEGISARYDCRDLVNKNEIINIHNCSNNVANFIGFSENWQLNFPDNRFDSLDILDIIKSINKIKNIVLPDIIFTHFEGDLSVDHRITFQAVLTSCRPMQSESVKEIYSYEVPSSTEWVSPFSGHNCFRPNIFVDIEKNIDKKISAMEMYESENTTYPHPRSSKSLKIIANRWGTVCGLKYVEPFVLIRKIYK